jgi:deazaflavin-dependent oxidoreductase (nitroreductase family)
MTTLGHRTIGAPMAKPRFGGILWRLARATSSVMIRFAGHRWNPIFSVVEHTGRRTGRGYAAPVAARRVNGGFVIALAFGAQVDWHRNLIAAGAGMLRSGGRTYRIGSPVRIEREAALPAFLPVQRLGLRLAGIDGFVRVAESR